MAHVLSLRRKEDNLMKETRTGRLVTSAVLLALATVLSLIRVYKLPLGGSITLLSMLPVLQKAIVLWIAPFSLRLKKLPILI